MMIFSKIEHYFQNVRAIAKSITGDYNFTFHDLFHYLRFAESPGPLKKFPQMIKIDEDAVFTQFKIGSFSYYWPLNFSLEGIPWMYQEVFVSSPSNPHAYEYGTLQINRGDVVIDAGACEGFFTRYALEKGATVIAIEPVKQLADALEKTFSREISNKSVTVVNNAIGSSKRTGHLFLNKEAIFESHLDSLGDPVDIMKLDDLPSLKIDFIKMDIEGAEVEALYGAQKIISKFKPKLSIAVYHKYENAQTIINYLQDLCPDYIIEHRGIYADNLEKPRPMMIYAFIHGN
jgi:FkbM family methyltransferase